MKLSPLVFGLTAGLVAGIGWLVVMVFSLLTGVLDQTVQAWCSIHPRCAYTYGGALWMLIMHLVVGGVIGFIFAWLYNLLHKMFSKPE